MKNKVIEVLERDENVKELINEFKVDFNKVYNKLNHEEKSMILNFRDAIFRIWLNSPYIDDTYITSNLIINNIAQHNIKGEYSIIPHIKMKLDSNGKLDFETRWVYYSIDSLPVIGDIDLLIKHSIPSLVVRGENPFVVDKGELLIEEINFRSGYYIEYLIDISIRLGILKEMKAIGCKVYQVTDKYDNFSKLDNKQKAKLITSNSIEWSNSNLQSAPYIEELLYKNKNEKITLNILDNNIGDEEYFNNIDLISSDINNMLNNIESYTDDKKVVEELNGINDILEGDIAEEIIRQEVGVFLDMNFLSLFGYYLGVIKFAYRNFFILDILVELLLKAEENIEKLSLIFRSDIIHDLTPFGETLIRDYKKNINKKAFNSIDTQDFKKVISHHYI